MPGGRIGGGVRLLKLIVQNSVIDLPNFCNRLPDHADDRRCSMTPRLPGVTGKDAVRALLGAGFAVDRVVGSRYILAHPDVVPGGPSRCSCAALRI